MPLKFVSFQNVFNPDTGGITVIALDTQGELWCDLMDCNEEADLTGEIRVNGKCVAKMRKLGNEVSS